MGGIIGALICILAVILLAFGDHSIALPIAVFVAALNIVSFSVMLKYVRYPVAAPDSWTRANFVTFFTGVVLIIVSFF